MSGSDFEATLANLTGQMSQPAGNGTIMRMGFDGYDCALAVPQIPAAHTATAAMSTV
jgi:hypothetical protein